MNGIAAIELLHEKKIPFFITDSICVSLIVIGQLWKKFKNFPYTTLFRSDPQVPVKLI